MSFEQILPNGDFRSSAQDYKRDAARKAKWALGPIERAGSDPSHPRPFRPSETAYNSKRRETKSAVAASSHACKSARKGDIDVTDAIDVIADEKRSSLDPEERVEASTLPPADTGVMYSYDAIRGPSGGSQILNVALAKAVDRYEEKETTKLVKNEYDIIDSTGESVSLTTAKRSMGKSKAPARPVVEDHLDDEYEFI